MKLLSKLGVAIVLVTTAFGMHRTFVDHQTLVTDRAFPSVEKLSTAEQPLSSNNRFAAGERIAVATDSFEVEGLKKHTGVQTLVSTSNTDRKMPPDFGRNARRNSSSPATITPSSARSSGSYLPEEKASANIYTVIKPEAPMTREAASALEAIIPDFSSADLAALSSIAPEDSGYRTMAAAMAGISSNIVGPAPEDSVARDPER